MASKFYLHKLSKRAKAEQGRPWIYTDEIKEYDGDYQNGDIVEVYNHKHYFIGKGYINDASKIAIRIMTRDINEEINEEFFKKRFKAAWDYRKTVIDTSSCRFIFGEADFLPGLTVDKFEDYYVIQISTLGMDKYRDIIVKILVEEYCAKGVYERSDLKTREIEGLEQTKGFLTEPFDTNIQIIENGVKYIVDLENGQKTGFFLDQKENRKAIHRICKDKDVLDCFTHTGSFALNAGIAGAKSVLGIDVSQHAVDCATRNAEINNLQDTVKFECHNAFDVLSSWSKEGKKFDVVILDPPAFTKSRDTVSGAKRGYKEINLRGLKMVKEGGYFVTCSCSHYMSEELLKETIAQAAHDAHRTLRQIEFRTQSSDHPILWNSDESYYLKFFVFQVV
ncbi:N2,N2-dimethylguanosine tRNA methyltransferase family protein [Clostridium baratii str. Sullivan]|uniref:N2,N2-dimethylguanosine tRNA methyltransferase family protein n=1 Tax=Clostridium baratii str. Sullivan TaxID=1415775 RepID=A0A0A7FZV4_9CLOT|nr:class I SAM-dependent rRNA methyltransferase [Clostridium baratii]AIY85127.1 N2,N2-dimethylguanosine tRNA methyltransferase family protein [Clostridium baratii str. Sullivan]MDU1054614.1 class I SAM-dependent rRNA methyltransferase [Clostridium baratii]